MFNYSTPTTIKSNCTNIKNCFFLPPSGHNLTEREHGTQRLRRHRAQIFNDMSGLSGGNYAAGKGRGRKREVGRGERNRNYFEKVARNSLPSAKNGKRRAGKRESGVDSHAAAD